MVNNELQHSVGICTIWWYKDGFDSNATHRGKGRARGRGGARTGRGRVLELAHFDERVLAGRGHELVTILPVVARLVHKLLLELLDGRIGRPERSEHPILALLALHFEPCESISLARETL